jgi:hypothetical protein
MLPSLFTVIVDLRVKLQVIKQICQKICARFTPSALCRSSQLQSHSRDPPSLAPKEKEKVLFIQGKEAEAGSELFCPVSRCS